MPKNRLDSSDEENGDDYSSGHSAESVDKEIPLKVFTITDKVTMSIGVNAENELKKAGKTTSEWNQGGNYVKITVRDPNAHILQFAIRQAFNINIAQKNINNVHAQKKLEPLLYKGRDYMKNIDEIKWSVDRLTGGADPFFDNEPDSMCIRTGQEISIYDRPTVSDSNERIVFCTFVIIEDQVHCTIKWSRQFFKQHEVVSRRNPEISKTETEKVYSIVCDTTSLPSIPDWAIKAIQDDGRFPSFINGSEIDRINARNPEEVSKEARCCVIAPDARWYLTQKYPEFFNILVQELGLMSMDQVTNSNQVVSFFPISTVKINGLDIQYIFKEDISSGGNGLYEAVAIYLNNDVMALRRNIAYYIENHKEECTEIIKVDPNHSTIEEYITDVVMGGKGEWADYLEIDLLMKAFNRPIYVIGQDGNIKNQSNAEKFDSGEQPIFVYYNGHNHYYGLVQNGKMKNSWQIINFLKASLSQPKNLTIQNLTPKSIVPKKPTGKPITVTKTSMEDKIIYTPPTASKKKPLR